MFDQEELQVIIEAREMAQKLSGQLREDALHRLRLYHEYPENRDGLKWTPDLQQRMILIESLCKKLDTIFCRKAKQPVTRKDYSGFSLPHV